MSEHAYSRARQRLLIIQFLAGMISGLVGVQLLGGPNSQTYPALLTLIILTVIPIEALKYFIDSGSGRNTIRQLREWKLWVSSLGKLPSTESLAWLETIVAERVKFPAPVELTDYRSVGSVLDTSPPKDEISQMLRSVLEANERVLRELMDTRHEGIRFENAARSYVESTDRLHDSFMEMVTRLDSHSHAILDLIERLDRDFDRLRKDVAANAEHMQAALDARSNAAFDLIERLDRDIDRLRKDVAANSEHVQAVLYESGDDISVRLARLEQRLVSGIYARHRGHGSSSELPTGLDPRMLRRDEALLRTQGRYRPVGRLDRT